MAVAFRGGPSTSAPSDGSRTITLRDSQPREEGDDAGSSHDPAASEVGRIPLRGGRQRPRVVWAEDTVDNEHMGKKSSKICCIYHKPRKFDESSSEESSSESDSDSSCGGRDPDRGVQRRKRRHHHRDHDANGEGQGDATRKREGGETVVHELSDEEEVNTYEKGPGKSKGKGIVRK